MVGLVQAVELTDTDAMQLDSVIVSDSLFGLSIALFCCHAPPKPEHVL